MDQDITREVDTSLAAHAFGELRAEISLLRRAVERLTDERTSQPDYVPSLEAIAKRLEDVCASVERLSEQPALKLTPQAMAREIASAATASRERDHEMLRSAAANMNGAAGTLSAALTSARSAAEQNRELLQNRVAFAVAGMVAFAIVPGAIARSLPLSWAVPERIAARMLGTDMWQAGEQMMAKADPERWQQIVVLERHTISAWAESRNGFLHLVSRSAILPNAQPWQGRVEAATEARPSQECRNSTRDQPLSQAKEAVR